MEQNIHFWQAVDKLVSSGKIIIDRPKGSTHPRYPEIKYELDYGYILQLFEEFFKKDRFTLSVIVPQE